MKEKKLYRLQFKGKYSSLLQVETIIQMLEKDGWNRKHFEIVEVS